MCYEDEEYDDEYNGHSDGETDRKLIYDESVKVGDLGCHIKTEVYSRSPHETIGPVEIVQSIYNWAEPNRFVGNTVTVTLHIEELKQILSALDGTLIGKLTGDQITFRHEKDQLYGSIQDKAVVLKAMALDPNRGRDMLSALAGSELPNDFCNFLRSVCAIVYMELADRMLQTEQEDDDG